jgi:heavy metal sensor kinase
MWWRTVRARLTFWHAVILGTLIILVAASVLVFMQHIITQQGDRFLAAAAGAFRTELLAERSEIPQADAAMVNAIREFHLEDIRIIVVGPAPGRALLAATSALDVSSGEEPPALDLERLRAEIAAHDLSRPVFFTLSTGEAGFRVFARPERLDDTPFVITVVQPLYEQQEAIEKVRFAFAVAVPVLLVLATLAAYSLAGRSLAPVSAMSRRSTEISAKTLHERLPVANPHDELGALASVINGLLDRLERSFAQQRRFMADASHELRTPVAILRNEAEIVLAREERALDEYRAALVIVKGEGVKLTRIVDDLFLLARADAGEQPLRPVELYLDELASDIVRGLRSLAQTRETSVELATEGEAPYRGDEDLLRRLLSNLIENAIKYASPGGHVRTSVRSGPHSYIVTVSDDGPGIAPDFQPHIFERFFRADKSRSRSNHDTGGAGLGLSIARWVAEAHGGKLDLVHSDPGGSEFQLTLPWERNLTAERTARASPP